MQRQLDLTYLQESKLSAYWDQAGPANECNSPGGQPEKGEAM